MSQQFARIAIVNRGESAMRLIHAVREFNREHDLDIKTIALYTEPERRAMFVREASEAVSLGGASFVDQRDGQRKNAYLNYDALEKALLASKADAAWVGWGFVAEHPEFADLCERLGINFVGPDGDCMRRLGDKISSKKMAEQVGVPVAPWSGGPVASVEQARAQARHIGYPLMVKATAGGGGRGIRSARSDKELDEAFERAASESLKSFGDGTVFMEKMMEGARHIEVQVIADGQGNAWSVGVRDCSVQRRNQKLIEESSSPVLSAQQEEFIKLAAARLCLKAGYRNAGTVEFLYDPRKKSFAFMEVNARLQVEHPVTEESTDLDLVKMQLHVARGGRLEGDPPAIRGNAIEIRLNAEDPEKDFAPAPGLIELLRLPTGAGIRVDTGVEQGDSIPAEFDSMIAKIIAHGRDRNEALSRLRRALSELAVVIHGGTTNRAFLMDLLGLPTVIDGTSDVGWLDREPPSKWNLQRPHGELALVLAAILVYEKELDAERQLFMASAARGRPRFRGEVARSVELRLGGNSYRLQVYRYGNGHYRVDVDDRIIRLSVEKLGRFERRIVCQGRTHRALATDDGIGFLVEIDGIPHRVSRDDGGTVRSVAPAVVVSMNVAPGQAVERGDTLAILEAMKLEMRVVAPFCGTVHQVDVSKNEQIDAGASLLRLKPSANVSDESTTERVLFDDLAGDTPGDGHTATQRCDAVLRELNAMVLGYDVDPTTSKTLLATRRDLQSECYRDDPLVLAHEERLLTAFADLCALSRREPASDAGGRTRPSAQESLFTYLRAIDTQGEGLPEAFIADLQRALAHYGVHDLRPGGELEEALLWIHKAHTRVDHQVPVVVSVLQRRLEDIKGLLPQADEGLRNLLERLIAVSRDRYPAVADLAGEVRFQYFDSPQFETTRRAAYADAKEHFDKLAREPDGAQRQAHMDAIVRCSQPLMTVMSDWYLTADAETRALILESLTRRYYRHRNLETVKVTQVDARHPVLTAQYDHEGKRICLITTYADFDNLPQTGQLLVPVIGDVPHDHDIVMDLFVNRESDERSAEHTLAQVRQALNAVAFGRRIRRIATSVRIPGSGLGMAGQRFFTFRHTDEGYTEETTYGSLHPMMAKRMHLWRLGNFSLERLPSIEDVYLFHGKAKDNPRDERLFAIAEVRDVTRAEDESGRLVGLPYLEHMFQEALAGIRLFQSHRPARRRLHWNRVLLYVWPELVLTPEERSTMALDLCKRTRGLGLEKIVIRARMPRTLGAQPVDTVMFISNPTGRGPVIDLLDPQDHTVQPLTPYRQKVLKMRQRGLHYPYEVIQLLTPDENRQSEFPPGSFDEYDFDDNGAFVAVERPYGGNKANVVVGLIRNQTRACPEGMTRVIILGDPSRGMGALAEPECSRIIAALDLAQQQRLPVEWFAVSAGALIALDSGTENLDWTAAVLRRLVEFTQAGGEVNVIVHGINVGAQSYWNAEATMLMHTRGILVMTPHGAMVLTGKQALDYSGGVSAEDNFGIGGYDRIMGRNGQAQYWAGDFDQACQILFRHYEHSYVVPGERFPRALATTDAPDRDVCVYPYAGAGVDDFRNIGEVFSNEHNPGRKRPFAIRRIMRAVVDQDHEPLERWSAMRDAQIGVIWDACVGGRPVCLIGLESRPLPRPGFVPADGPVQWTAGTLFPQSSRKIARAINAASANRPVVVLANLSGFDGSPESMRNWQLEYGAEIGRSIVNFKGPIVFCVVSRYHGGAFVVFSKSLNENMEVAALDGAYASVIGGAPAAAVVFVREVRQATNEDARVVALKARLDNADGAERARLLAEYDELYKEVEAHKRGELAARFDAIHSVERAREVGSIDAIIAPGELRPYLIGAVERGMQRELQRIAGDA